MELYVQCHDMTYWGDKCQLIMNTLTVVSQSKMAAKAGKEKVVDLNQLSIPELDRLKNQIEQVRL